MRLVWELFRAAWAVGCLPVGALLLVVVVFSGFNLPFFLGLASGEEPAIRWLFWALALYFVGGGWLFSRVNRSYAAKLRKMVAGYQAEGFFPHIEVFASRCSRRLMTPTLVSTWNRKGCWPTPLVRTVISSVWMRFAPGASFQWARATID